MKIVSAKTIIKYQGQRMYNSWDRSHEAETRWSYIHLKTRKKIKKKKGVAFIYDADILEWNAHMNKYTYVSQTITLHAIRSMFQNKMPDKVMYSSNENWNVLCAKHFLTE